MLQVKVILGSSMGAISLTGCGNASESISLHLYDVKELGELPENAY